MSALSIEEVDAALAQLERSRRSRPALAPAAPVRSVEPQHDPVRFPAEDVADVIREAVAEDGLVNFAARSGVPERTIYGILNGERESVGFGIADELVTRGLGQPNLFHDDPRLAGAFR